LSQGEVALLGAYQRASAEFAGTQQTLINARAQLASLEDQAMTLLGKSSGILESLLAMKFPVEEAPSTGGNGVAKKKEKVHARA
jgi:outer membrane protein TolC